MRCARPALIAPVLLGLIVSSGCYGPYQQSPYGPWGPYGSPYGGYPGVGGPGIQTLQPGSTYTPGTIPPGGFSTPTPIDSTGTDGAFYEPNGDTQNYDGGNVPTYNDASDTLQFHQQQHGSPNNTADDTTLDAFGSIEDISATVTGAARVDLETAQFVAPVPLSQGASASEASTVPLAPYAYDAEYHWLRGILRHDATSNTWLMTYSSNPAETDVHAGQIVVADSPQLSRLKPQAIVLLRGEVDSALSETAGRAIYRVDAVETVDLALP